MKSYSSSVVHYRPKADLRSARLGADMRTEQVRNFGTERGPVQTDSSIRVRRVETIGGKRFKVCS